MGSIGRIGSKDWIVVHLGIGIGNVWTLIGDIVVGDGRRWKWWEIEVGVWVERIAKVISHSVL